VEAFAAFVAVGTGALAAGQEVWLGSAAVEAVIEAGLVTEADIGEAHAAGGTMVFGTTKGARRDGRERRAAVEAVFGGWSVGCRGGRIFDRGSESRGLGTFGAARA
jgi:hypothetical protein